jgi:hypothetical protein
MWPLTAVRFSDSLPKVEMQAGEFDGESSLARSHNIEKRLLASLCLSVRMEDLGSHRTGFHKISHLSSFLKFVEKIQVLLKSDNNNLYFT